MIDKLSDITHIRYNVYYNKKSLCECSAPSCERACFNNNMCYRYEIQLEFYSVFFDSKLDFPILFTCFPAFNHRIILFSFLGVNFLFFVYFRQFSFLLNPHLHHTNKWIILISGTTRSEVKQKFISNGIWNYLCSQVKYMSIRYNHWTSYAYSKMWSVSIENIRENILKYGYYLKRPFFLLFIKYNAMLFVSMPRDKICMSVLMIEREQKINFWLSLKQI